MVWRALATLTVEWTRTDDASGAQESVTSVLYLGAVDPNGDYYARLADSNAVSTLNATALSGVLGMTLDGMLPTEEESAPESAPASESGSGFRGKRSGLRVLQKGSSH